MILVTGATGHLGTTVIDYLLTKVAPTEIAGFARSEEKAALLKAKGIEVRIGNFDNLHSLENAMNGIDKVLLISSNDHSRLFQQHKNVIDAARAAGVSYIVYTGTAVKDRDTSPLKAMLEAHFQTEHYLKESSVPYTILRNTEYADAIPILVGDRIFEEGICIPAENGKSPFVLRREMGEAAANVLLQKGHENKTYELTGCVLYSFADVADALSELSGKPISYFSPDPKKFEETLKQAGVPEFGVNVISGFIADKRNGKYEILSNDLENLLGRKPMSLKESLREVYAF